MPSRVVPRLAGALAALAAGAHLAVACGAPPSAVAPTSANAGPPTASSPSRAVLETHDASSSSSDASASEPPEADSSSEAECPPDMLHVKQAFCPEVDRDCMKSEYDKANHITICHRFREGSTRCKAPRISLDYCIDRYEYPNEKGAHQPVMVSFFDASGLCAERGKRLCYESEWTAACEGPEEKPFPYGWQRSAEKCNIDNPWVNPSLKKIYSDDPAISDPELQRLDRSVPSGSKPGCVSDFGVFDLTGNVDEWTLADRDRPKEKGRFAALKGGAWGHVRNACRPVTTSHEPEFTYYFVGFRCCRDTASSPAFSPTK